MTLDKIISRHKFDRYVWEDCPHYFVFYIGEQEGYGTIQGFPMGNCCYCKSTINMKDYHVKDRCYFNGQQIYESDRLMGDE